MAAYVMAVPPEDMAMLQKYLTHNGVVLVPQGDVVGYPKPLQNAIEKLGSDTGYLADYSFEGYPDYSVDVFSGKGHAAALDIMYAFNPSGVHTLFPDCAEDNGL